MGMQAGKPGLGLDEPESAGLSDVDSADGNPWPRSIRNASPKLGAASKRSTVVHVGTDSTDPRRPQSGLDLVTEMLLQ